MRISTQQIHTQAIASMLDSSRQVALTQQQIASGRKFTTPADDPVAASRIVNLNQELSLRSQYQRNIELATSQLSLEDAVLSQANEVLQRVRELALQGANGALTAKDRAFLGAEVETRLDELFAIMNTRTATGEYLFAGFKGQTQPFVRDSSNGVVFRGDEGQRRVQVSSTSQVAVNDSGQRLFMDVASTATTFVTRAHPGNDPERNVTIGQGVVVDQVALDAFFPDRLVVEFNPPSADHQGRANFTVRRMSDNRVVDGLANVVHVPGAAVEAQGMQFKLYGEPAAGDRFVIESTRTQNVVSTVARLAEGLTGLSDSDKDLGTLQTLVDGTIGNLERAMDSILTVRAEVGARLNTADSSALLHQDVEIITKDVLSKLRDVDYAEAVSRLNLQAFVLEAAQRSYGRISGLSLFNVI
jgi:flagellar hook-associated protein 3 FlgL